MRRKVSRRFRQTCALLALCLSCGVGAFGQRTGTDTQQLYLLFGTPGDKLVETYPVRLFRVGANNELVLVREVVPKTAGLRIVRMWGHAIFVVSPRYPATTVSIVHTDDPTRKDDVTVSGKGVFPDDGLTVVATPQGTDGDLLLPWIADSSDPTHVVWTLASISSDPSQSGPRVKFNHWDEYAALRYEGGTGGPELISPPACVARSGELEVIVHNPPIIIDSLPPELRDTNTKLVISVEAESQDYLLLRAFDPSTERPASSEKMFLHDRAKDRWSTIQVEGNRSEQRLFGPWLATLVRMNNTDKKPGPGRGHEPDGAIDGLPNIQYEYATWAGRFYWMPGVLVLQNLVDGRKIRIETDAEDSEILWAGSDRVVYRVDDTIFQARIVGDKLQGTTVLVHDGDVPGVHWVFWSK
jgi:hypothetical protein